ncbi:MAG: type 1 glutamine amidotransferase domain-containing protein [Solidesulfovibrio sp. DCME]|uniref:type 1 glutamine amidotransferase domain-containing protein n=1 Tax=Solidesulfovibrio sp. DCME TaxID=3447380 RepID=UPI003D104892
MNAKKALILSADNFEDSELLYPLYRLREAGFQVDVAAPAAGTITGKHGYAVEANLGLEAVESAGSCGYSLLVLPGGKAPAALRTLPKAIDIVEDFASSGIPMAAICHGPQLLVTARLLRGRRATCYTTVADELREAGALYEDAAVVVDGNLVTSRMPGDLPDFMREVMKKVG